MQVGEYLYLYDNITKAKLDNDKLKNLINKYDDEFIINNLKIMFSYSLKNSSKRKEIKNKIIDYIQETILNNTTEIKKDENKYYLNKLISINNLSDGRVYNICLNVYNFETNTNGIEYIEAENIIDCIKFTKNFLYDEILNNCNGG